MSSPGSDTGRETAPARPSPKVTQDISPGRRGCLSRYGPASERFTGTATRFASAQLRCSRQQSSARFDLGLRLFAVPEFAIADQSSGRRAQSPICLTRHRSGTEPAGKPEPVTEQFAPRRARRGCKRCGRTHKLSVVPFYLLFGNDVETSPANIAACARSIRSPIAAAGSASVAGVVPKAHGGRADMAMS